MSQYWNTADGDCVGKTMLYTKVYLV